MLGAVLSEIHTQMLMTSFRKGSCAAFDVRDSDQCINAVPKQLSSSLLVW